MVCVETESVCGVALPAPTLMVAVVVRVGGVVVPTVPLPRLIVITLFATGAASAVPVMGVAIEVVMVAAVVPGFVIVTCTCTDCPHPRNGVGLGESEIAGEGVITGGVGRSTVPDVFVRIG